MNAEVFNERLPVLAFDAVIFMYNAAYYGHKETKKFVNLNFLI